MISLFVELGTVLIVASLLALLFHRIKQPLILAYLIAGVIFVQFYTGDLSADIFQSFAQIGIAFLLFLVGLNMDIRVFREVGKTSLLTGIGQVLFTTFIGYFLVLWLGFSAMTAFYVSLALAFSSTIIIIKLLTDKNDLEALYGKIAIGFLLVQDLIVILLLIFIVAWDAGNLSAANIVVIFGKGALLFILAVIFHHAFKRFIGTIGRSQELLFLVTISWCFFLSMMAQWFGFSIEIGAFIAGVTLASLPFKLDIVNKIKPLRDFFLILFFVVLGTQLSIGVLQEMLWPAIILSLFVLIGNPLIVMILMGLLGYKSRNSFLAGLTVAQISEFSLILITLGVGLGHIAEEILGLVTLVGIITIAASAYMITFGNQLYDWLAPYLKVFERKKLYEKKLTLHTKKKKYSIVLVGYHSIGYNILERLRKKKMRFIVVDYNPTVIKNLMKKKIPCLYGDVADHEVLREIKQFKPKMIISTIHLFEDNIHLVDYFKKYNKKILIYGTGKSVDEALELYEHGANYVIVPHLLGGERVADLLKHTLKSKRQLHHVKKKHIKHLITMDLPEKV